MIDLRSDTITRPTDAMRRAMAEAEVGDDVFGEDPTVRELEERTAQALGRPSSLFVPSGTMSNQLGVYTGVGSGEEMWAHEASHILGNEQGGSSVLARALPRAFAAPEGYPDDALLSRWARGVGDIHRARPRLVCLENTFSGLVIPPAEQRRVADFAHAHGMRVHLDGARLWNAAAALGISPAEAADGADTVSVCFSKGLGAPVGSALVGDEETIHFARRARKLLGGGMRQAGVIAAGALYALRHHADRLADDHVHAARLAAGLADTPGIAAVARTNMVLVSTPDGEAEHYAAAFTRHGVGCVAFGSARIRLVTHLEITAADTDTAVSRIRDAVKALGD